MAARRRSRPRPRPGARRRRAGVVATARSGPSGAPVAGRVGQGVVEEAAEVAGLSRAGTVHAAGGVVWRPGASGEPDVLLVHRPKYEDWTLPKGKLDPGEGSEEAALREVEEETGLRCILGPE